MIFSSPKKFILFFLPFTLSIFFLLFFGSDVLAKTNVYDDSDVPRILARSVWENSPQLKSLLKIVPARTLLGKEGERPTYYPVSRIIIHDTECQIYLPSGERNPNCNSVRQNSLALLQNIYRYHVLTKGYNDIGYHFIIDWNGRIFEGRYGGNASVGDHSYQPTSCRDDNIGSIGILLLGNLEKEKPSSAMYNSLARLVGWLSMANSIDPDQRVRTLAWEGKKISKCQGGNTCSSSCDFRYSSAQGDWTTNSVLYYQDLFSRKTNYLLDMKDLRRQAKLFANEFRQRYAYQDGEDNTVWSFQQGIRERNTRIGVRVLTLDPEQIYYFPQKKGKAVKNGDLIKPEGQDSIYFIHQKKCSKIISQDVFKAWRFKPQNIKEVDPHFLNCSFGAILAYPPGTLLRARGEKEVYLVNKAGLLTHINSAPLFRKLGFRWKDVIIISPEEEDAFAKTKPLFFPDGSLLKGDSKTVYFVSAGTLRPLKYFSLFQAYHFDWNNVVELSKDELSAYPVGDYLDYPDGVLIRAQNNAQIYFLDGGRRNLVENSALIHSLPLTFNQLIIVPDSEALRYPLGVRLKTEDDIDRLMDGLRKINGDFLQLSHDKSYQNFPSIRIGLTQLSGDSTLALRANKDYNVYENGELKDQEPAEFVYHIYLKDLKGKLRFSSPSGNVIFTIVDGPKDKFSHIGRKYRGSLELIEEGGNESNHYFWLVNELLVEDYLRGIKQKIESDNLEFYKALIIAARSYVLHYGGIGEIPGFIHYPNKPFQLYYQEGDLDYQGYEAENSYLARAVDETEGEILTYHNKPARTIYSYDTCGFSRNAALVFGSFYQQFPYLRGGIRDPQKTEHSSECPNVKSNRVGMSLAGAQELSSEGEEYYQILTYYYPGTKLNKFY